MICTFFGHSNTPKEIEPILRSTLIDLIENKNVNLFYVGNHGGFDFIVRKVLKELKIDYPHIIYSVVLAYLPTKKMNLITRIIPMQFTPMSWNSLHQNSL